MSTNPDELPTTARADTKQVIIIGAGFAGLAAAHELAGTALDVTLIDANNFHTFQPLLYQVATAGLDSADIAFPVRAAFPRATNLTVHRARVERIDSDARAIDLDDGSRLGYDALIVATGATTSFFAIDGAAQHARPLYTLRDARALCNALLRALDAADADPAKHDGGALSFVVVGGGATGVEVAGAIVELLDVSMRHDRLHIDRSRSRVIVVDVGDRLLSAFGTRASAYALNELARRGIEVRFQTAVTAVDESAVHLKDGSAIRADVVVWAGGVTVDGTLAAGLPGERGRGGRVVVGHDLALAGHREIFVVGDAAAVPLRPDADDVAPQLAQVAIQSGRHAARQLLARFAGTPPPAPFVYKDKGMMATIGRRAAVAELQGPGPLRGVVLKGVTGWFAWLGLHLIYLVGGRNRVVVLLNWLWRYAGWSAGPRVILEDE